MRRLSLELRAAISLAAASAGCSQNNNLAPPYVFDRPGDVALVCHDLAKVSPERFDKEPAPEGTRAETALPLVCCMAGEGRHSSTVRVRPEREEPACAEAVRPELHALVTQTGRGELAAVNLDATSAGQRVIDSDRLIPGYSFIDVSALPVAVVVPPHQPGDPETGPSWAYVASGGGESVVAVSTCRLRRGTACAADASLSRAERTVELPSAPADMVLDPGGAALWVSLPEEGGLARIDLDAGGAPFAAASLDTQAFYPLPAQAIAAPSEPVAEPSPYLVACGLGHAYEPMELSVPLAPVQEADPSLAPAPARMRFDEVSGLLFVTDARQPALYTLGVLEGQPTLTGALATGAPLRDFSVTPEVAVSAPELEALFAAPTTEEYVPAETKRYLYAIDDRDGSVMVFELSIEAGEVDLLPLEAPPGPRRFRDRLAIDGVATALDVVDTRAVEPWICADSLSAPSWDDVPPAGTNITTDNKAQGDEGPGEPNGIVDTLDARATKINQEAGSGSLRGVFVIVASSTGAVSVVDVQDLDLHCRAQKGCAQCSEQQIEDDECTPALAEGASEGLMLRRHAPRLASVGRTRVSIARDDGLSPLEEGCPEGYYEADDDALLCLPRDPWQLDALQLSLDYEPALTGLTAFVGSFEPSETDDRLVFQGGVGVDFCERGTAEQGSEVDPAGDWLVIASEPEDESDKQCNKFRSGDEERYRIVEAYRDRLVIEPRADGEGSSDAALLEECYPELLVGQVQVGGQYVVAQGVYHRMSADEDGRCMVDEETDARRTLRASAGETYAAPFAVFRLAEEEELDDGSADEDTLRASVSIGGVPAPVRRSVIDLSSVRTDALPVRVRYFRESGDLFVVDQASQGLRRFTLSPFEADSNSRFYR